MRFERLKNLPCNGVKPKFVAIFVVFVIAVSFIELFSRLKDRGETGSHLVSLSLLGSE